MALSRRPLKSSSSVDSLHEEENHGNRERKGVDVGLVLFLLCGALAVAFAVTQEHQAAAKRTQIDGIKQSLEEGVILSLEMDRKNDFSVTLGPHKARVAIGKKGCPKPRLWMRLVGAALISIPMDPENDDRNRWSAAFAFPIEGEYLLDVRWYGCGDEETSFTKLAEPISFTVKGGNSQDQILTTRSSNPEIFPAGFWALKRKFKNAVSIHSPYVWFSESKKGTLPSATPHLLAETRLGVSSVAMEGYQISTKGFHDLTNYELVCWVGSSSASLIREAFLSLKGQIDPEQRDFKFHYYPLNDFSHADKDWEDRRSGFRKCKTVLISVDELADDISQAEYKKQVEYFIHQVLECLHDSTFPIWMFTVNNSPMISSSKMCHSPARHTHNHPCNDALFELFDRNKRFPPQVKLLDNTEVTDPQFGENKNDIHAVIAMRIFALIAAQVDDWRSMDQKGLKAGLMRNGTLEPNEVQEDYKFEPFVAKA